MISGILTPQCAAVVTVVLESLSAQAGRRTPRRGAARYHDGLQEAMARLVASGLLPQRAGQPVKAWAPCGWPSCGRWMTGRCWPGSRSGRWPPSAARRAAASEGGGGEGRASLNSKAARAVACDAILSPVVTRDVDPGVLDDLVRLCVELDHLERRHHPPAPGQHRPGEGSPARPTPARPTRPGRRQAARRARPRPLGGTARSDHRQGR